MHLDTIGAGVVQLLLLGALRVLRLLHAVFVIHVCNLPLVRSCQFYGIVRFQAKFSLQSYDASIASKRAKEDAMELKYTEVPGAALAAMMLVSWMLLLMIAIASAIVG